MTSVGFNIGYNMKEDKPSSKVLKPPGGGSSDIFGRRDGQEGSQGGKRHGGPAPKDTHDRIFGYVGREQAAKDESEKSIETEPENGKNTEHEEFKEIEKSIETPEAQPPPAKPEAKEEKKVEEPAKTSIRIRQPPGGKSSGIF